MDVAVLPQEPAQLYATAGSLWSLSMRTYMLEVRLSDAQVAEIEEGGWTPSGAKLDAAQLANIIADALADFGAIDDALSDIDIIAWLNEASEPIWMDAVRAVGIGWPKRGGDPDDWGMEMAAIARSNGAECDFVMTAGTGPRGPIDLSAVLITHGERRYRVDIRPSRNTYKDSVRNRGAAR